VLLGLSFGPQRLAVARPQVLCRAVAASLSIISTSFVFLSLLLQREDTTKEGQEQQQTTQRNHGSNFLPRMGAHGKERWSVVEKMEWQKKDRTMTMTVASHAAAPMKNIGHVPCCVEVS
jgi:hypothetical protein